MDVEALSSREVTTISAADITPPDLAHKQPPRTIGFA